MPPKKSSPGITVILIDAGASMSEIDPDNGKTAFENAINTADWIISRKLFSGDPELFTIMSYNLDAREFSAKIEESQEFKGVVVHNNDFSPANFEHLKYIHQELQQNTKMTELDFFHGVLAAVSVLNVQLGVTPNPAGITLIVLTNGRHESIGREKFDLLVEAINGSNADLMIIGINENQDCPSSTIFELVQTLEGRTYTFQNASSMLSSYQARQKSERKYNKMWDIAPGIRLPVTFSLKSEQSSALLKFKNADSEGNEMVRLEQMHVEVESSSKDVPSNVSIEKGDVLDDETDSSQLSSGKLRNFKAVENTKTMHGYNFGKSVIMMDPDYLKEKYNDHNFNEGQTGGVLKLIQFTKRANILDSYLTESSAKTVLPALNSPNSGVTKATVSLIEAMLSLRVAAICRFTFHAKSHVQLVALLPHRDQETNVVYLRCVKLPFSDDMRTLKFPKLTFDDDDEDLNKPSVAQLSAVDDLIDCMQLQESEISNLVEGGVNDPKLQMQCHFLKSLVLHPNDIFENHSQRATKILDDIMAPKRRVETEQSGIFEKLEREFNLQPVKKTKRERVTVEPEDLQAIIAEWKKKTTLSEMDDTDDGVNQKKKKKPNSDGTKKLTRKEEVALEIVESGAGRACSRMIEMISNTCKFQPNGAITGFFQLLVNELNIIRSVFVEKVICNEFNELLRKIREEEEFEPFAAFLAEEKTCSPISSAEVPASDILEIEAAEFWEEK